MLVLRKVPNLPFSAGPLVFEGLLAPAKLAARVIDALLFRPRHEWTTDASIYGMDNAICLDTGWVEDGHKLYWNGHLGAACLLHPDHCLYVVEYRIRNYLCSPAHFERSKGIVLDDLPPEHADQCKGVSAGTEPIRWRLCEYIYPDLTIEQPVFSIELAVDDYEW